VGSTEIDIVTATAEAKRTDLHLIWYVIHKNLCGVWKYIVQTKCLGGSTILDDGSDSDGFKNNSPSIVGCYGLAREPNVTSLLLS
jgi:hypothetical protein